MVDYSKEAVWNMDDERLKSLNGYLVGAEDAFDRWDLVTLQKALLNIRRIIGGKLNENDEEWNEINRLFGEFYDLKKKAINDIDEIPNLYNKADQLYIYMNRVCKDHGLYFREKEDYRGL